MDGHLVQVDEAGPTPQQHSDSPPPSVVSSAQAPAAWKGRHSAGSGPPRPAPAGSASAGPPKPKRRRVALRSRSGAGGGGPGTFRAPQPAPRGVLRSVPSSSQLEQRQQAQ